MRRLIHVGIILEDPGEEALGCGAKHFKTRPITTAMKLVDYKTNKVTTLSCFTQCMLPCDLLNWQFVCRRSKSWSSMHEQYFVATITLYFDPATLISRESDPCCSRHSTKSYFELHLEQKAITVLSRELQLLFHGSVKFVQESTPPRVFH